MLNYIDAAMLKKAFLAGTGRLESKKAWINELNVFPVPDGDTGTNMCLTLLSAVKEMSGLDDNASLEEVGKCLATGTLKGARGNSGVILSQLFRGFSKELEGEEIVTADVIARAFDRAVVTAYKAVMKPKEGTILTVAKACATKASELSKTGMGLAQMFEEINTYAEYILSKTPDMLPVLKEAGVVDSGGQGLVEFL
ncbi:MAG: DAK2 domain-containing protein, partial [Parasporobacterium sp.]|nr:DAK2 domain-containing protein [Parasporobacterium sp.]